MAKESKKEEKFDKKEEEVKLYQAGPITEEV